ncbi:hypothetical protein GJAV_G00244310 [Gymnothorax javanicus]|nr:hypothetical protein GJAV_G00244310 [Gymnothorax javanicus]
MRAGHDNVQYNANGYGTPGENPLNSVIFACIFCLSSVMLIDGDNLCKHEKAAYVRLLNQRCKRHKQTAVGSSAYRWTTGASWNVVAIPSWRSSIVI